MAHDSPPITMKQFLSHLINNSNWLGTVFLVTNTKRLLTLLKISCPKNFLNFAKTNRKNSKPTLSEKRNNGRFNWPYDRDMQKNQLQTTCFYWMNLTNNYRNANTLPAQTIKDTKWSEIKSTWKEKYLGFLYDINLICFASNPLRKKKNYVTSQYFYLIFLFVVLYHNCSIDI